MPSSGQFITDAFAYVTCDTCEWSGGTDITIDLEQPRSMRTQYFTCPMCGRENERDIP